jgi:large subunit ribosomal protein L4
MDRISTKEFAKMMKMFGWEKTLFVIPAFDDTVEKSVRNIPLTKVIRWEGLNVYDMLNYHHLVLTQESVQRIEEFLGQ